MTNYNFDADVRNALRHAREEAARLHHEYVGTEHELLGLIRDESSRGVSVLARLDVVPDRVRAMVEESVKKGKAKEKPDPSLPYTSRAKKVLELAMTASEHLKHDYVGPEHLILGLMAEANGIAAQVLADCGVTLDRALDAVVDLTGAAHPGPWTPPKTIRGSEGLSVVIDSGAIISAQLDVVAAHAGAPVHAGAELTTETPLQAQLRREYDLDSLTRADRFAVIAELDVVPPEVVVELLAALDMMHRVWGGAGLVIESHTVGTTDPASSSVCV